MEGLDYRNFGLFDCVKPRDTSFSARAPICCKACPFKLFFKLGTQNLKPPKSLVTFEYIQQNAAKEIFFKVFF